MTISSNTTWRFSSPQLTVRVIRSEIRAGARAYLYVNDFDAYVTPSGSTSFGSTGGVDALLAACVHAFAQHCMALRNSYDAVLNLLEAGQELPAQAFRTHGELQHAGIGRQGSLTDAAVVRASRDLFQQASTHMVGRKYSIRDFRAAIETLRPDSRRRMRVAFDEDLVHLFAPDPRAVITIDMDS